MAHHAQVMADEQVGQAERLAQLHEQVEHLGLDGHVERRHGLVADQKTGLDSQRPGNAHAGALAARELVGEAVGQGRIQAHAAQLLTHPLVALGAAHQAVHRGRLAHKLGNAQARVERGERVLEDHLHLQPGGLARRGVQVL